MPHNTQLVPFSRLALTEETKKYFKTIAARRGGFMRLLKDYMETVTGSSDVKVWRGVVRPCESICIRVEEMMEHAHQPA